MLQYFKNYYQQNTLKSILIMALVLRVLAAIFAGGYGMHDDHFSIIEASQSWVDGKDYNNWLPMYQMAERYHLNDSIFEKVKHDKLESAFVSRLHKLENITRESKADYLCEIEKAVGKDFANQYSELILNYSHTTPKPDGHSFFYVGLHYLYFECCKMVGINNPVYKMILNRLLHALFSLLVVLMFYNITLKISSKKDAEQVAFLVAVLWFMPFLSVRNLVEVFCIPFLAWGMWLLLRGQQTYWKVSDVIWAGLIMGLAVSVRFQAIIFIGGAGLALLILKKWKQAILFGIFALISILIVQSVVDMYIWHRPFAEFQEYIVYNINERFAYGTGAKHYEMYLSVLLGTLIPPISLLWFFGFLRTWKKHLVIFLPTFLFLAFHTYFPNKQERFIFSIIPFVLMLGVVGWNEFESQSKYWKSHKKLLRAFYMIFGIVNLIMLCLMTFNFSKRPRVEAMTVLYNYKNINNIIVEASNNTKAPMLPNFYSGKWIYQYRLIKPENSAPFDSSSYGYTSKYMKDIYTLRYFDLNPCAPKPEFILFVNSQQLDERIASCKKMFPRLTFITKTSPSYLDRLIVKLNPKNTNEEIFIYRID